MAQAEGRNRENLQTIDLIRDVTDIPSQVIEMAESFMYRNPFHNADHSFFATRAAIQIAQAEGRSEQQLNLLTLAMLFHDAQHSGVATLFDEMESARIALSEIPDHVLACCRENRSQNLRNMLRDCIMATCISMRGKISDPLLRIVQDADLHHCAVGGTYWMYLCSGAGLELATQLDEPTFVDPLVFWKGGKKGGQRGFVAFLETLTGSKNILLTEGARKLWHGDADQNLQLIESWGDNVITNAFSLRDEDLTLAEYVAKLSSMSMS